MSQPTPGTLLETMTPKDALHQFPTFISPYIPWEA